VNENATDCVEIKRGEMFSVALHMFRHTLCSLAFPCPIHLPFPSYCDVAQARSHFASIVRVAFNSFIQYLPEYKASFFFKYCFSEKGGGGSPYFRGLRINFKKAVKRGSFLLK
jgi:hypothetical protein